MASEGLAFDWPFCQSNAGRSARDVYGHISPLDTGTVWQQTAPAWLPTREVSEMAVKRRAA